MKTMNILVINNYGQFCHLIHRTIRDMEMDTSIISNTSSVEDILSKEPDGLVLSGGPAMERAGNCAQYIREIDLPILGICLGHQVMAKTFGGEVGPGKYGGYAEVEVEILEENDILQGLAPKTSVWASHADEVKTLPEGFVWLARSGICEIEAMKHEKKPLYGVQWHPEVAHTEKGQDLFSNFFRVCEEY